MHSLKWWGGLCQEHWDAGTRNNFLPLWMCVCCLSFAFPERGVNCRSLSGSFVPGMVPDTQRDLASIIVFS